MSYWSEVKNNHVEASFDKNLDGAIVKTIDIDAWRAGCEEGEVIATVVLSEMGDVCVVYKNYIARSDKYAQEVIREAIDKIKITDWTPAKQFCY